MVMEKATLGVAPPSPSETVKTKVSAVSSLPAWAYLITLLLILRWVKAPLSPRLMPLQLRVPPAGRVVKV